LSPESEHLLDWFHITMRLTGMVQMIKGMTTEVKTGPDRVVIISVLADIEKHLGSVKWNLRHGNVQHALQRIDDLDDDMGILAENLANKRKLAKSV
jgi:hypothetical protein